MCLTPIVLCAQIRLKGSSELRVLENGAVRTSGNTEVESNALLSILGDYTTSGNLINSGNASNIIIESDANHTGSLIVEGSTSGNVRVERYLSPSCWHFLAPSVSDVKTGDFYFNGSPEVYARYFDEPSSTWSYLSGTSENMDLGMGYSIWVGESKTGVTAEMDGGMRNSDLSVNLSTSATGWNLIGNPFTSGIKVSEGDWGTNTSGSFWVWDTAFNNGDYRACNGLGVGDFTSGVIPISQSFFVYAETTGNYNIPKAAQSHGGDEFYKEEKSNDFVRLQLDAGSKGNTLYIGFTEQGSSGIDRIGDTYKLYSSYESPQIYGVQDGEKLCILADSPLYGQERVIPIYIDQWITGNYTLSIDDLGATYFDVYLEDQFANKMLHFSEVKEYQFSGNSGDSEDRFLLHFSRKAQSIEEASIEDHSVIVYSNNKSVYIQSKRDKALGKGDVQIYNISGQLVYENQEYIINYLAIPTNLGASCYFVHLNFDEVKMVKKVILN